MECVTVFERRSHLGPPDEGRLGPSDDDDDDDDNDNDDDLYIIGAVCLCVKKVIISVFKRFVSHVYRHFPYSRYLVISPVYRHFPYSRDFVVSPVSRHLWKRLEGKMFVRLQGWKVRRLEGRKVRR